MWFLTLACIQPHVDTGWTDGEATCPSPEVAQRHRGSVDLTASVPGARFHEVREAAARVHLVSVPQGGVNEVVVRGPGPVTLVLASRDAATWVVPDCGPVDRVILVSESPLSSVDTHAPTDALEAAAPTADWFHADTQSFRGVLKTHGLDIDSFTGSEERGAFGVLAGTGVLDERAEPSCDPGPAPTEPSRQAVGEHCPELAQSETICLMGGASIVAFDADDGRSCKLPLETSTSWQKRPSMAWVGDALIYCDGESGVARVDLATGEVERGFLECDDVAVLQNWLVVNGTVDDAWSWMEARSWDHLRCADLERITLYYANDHVGFVEHWMYTASDDPSQLTVVDMGNPIEDLAQPLLKRPTAGVALLPDGDVVQAWNGDQAMLSRLTPTGDIRWEAERYPPTGGVVCDVR